MWKRSKIRLYTRRILILNHCAGWSSRLHRTFSKLPYCVYHQHTHNEHAPYRQGLCSLCNVLLIIECHETICTHLKFWMHSVGPCIWQARLEVATKHHCSTLMVMCLCWSIATYSDTLCVVDPGSEIHYVSGWALQSSLSPHLHCCWTSWRSLCRNRWWTNNWFGEVGNSIWIDNWTVGKHL